MQLGRTFIQIATIIGAITVVMCVVDGVLFFRNLSLQAEVDQRQKFINDCKVDELARHLGLGIIAFP